LHKRALLLTAATFALLSGGAQATTAPTTNGCLTNKDPVTDITKAIKGPLCTSTAASGQPGNITIETNGAVSVDAVGGATPTIFPAITIDSSNLVTDKGTITFNGTNNAVGVQLNTGNTGGLDLQVGTLTMTGAGTSKVGILITDPTAGANGTFTGVAMPDAGTPLTSPTAIDIEAGSIVTIQGDGSTGIELAAGNTVAGDIVINGTLSMTPTKENEASNSGIAAIGVNLQGTLNGNLSIVGGTVSAEGPGAEGIVIAEGINGEFDNGGTIETVGSLQPDITKTTNPTSGIGVLIEGNITGGILNDGAVNASTTTPGTGVISVSGPDPALDIAAATANLTIGVVTDTNNVGFSFLNRGTIIASSPNPETNSTAVLLAGGGPTAIVQLTGGIFDSGTISAVSTTKDATASTTVTSLGIEIASYVNIPSLTLSDQTGSGGIISASVSGDQPGLAEAILIAPNSTLSTISVDTGSSIIAAATTTDDTNTIMKAVAINDESGTLTTINNDGTISGSATALINMGQVGEAINAAANTSGVKITNGGAIGGDIILGSGADTLIIGDSTDHTGQTAAVAGNIFFGGDLSAAPGVNDTMTINAFGAFAGQIEEPLDQRVDIAVNAGGTLIVENNGVPFDTADTSAVADTCGQQPEACGVQAGTFTTATGSSLTLDVAQIFNQDGTTANAPYVVNANSAAIANGTHFQVGYGSFINAVGSNGSQFVLVGTPMGALTIGEFGALQADVQSETPFLFDGSLCTINVTGGTPCTTTPKNFTGSGLILTLDPKTAKSLGLQGFAADMFDHANAALANDTTLGAAVISAGLPVNGKPLLPGVGAQLYQNIYSQFAPDVTGSARALAISMTDQATGEVGARQRALRMYAGQDGDTTIWGQEFTQDLSVGNNATAGGYNDTGFGFVLGADSGNPRSGRFGAAFQFYSGDTNEKLPRTDKTNSQWMVLTGYTDWRGKGFFFDSQASIGYGQLKGQRFINVGPAGDVVSRDAQGDRAAEFLSGGATTGVILAAGGTVFMPQLSLDGLTMREEGYTETSNTAFTTIAPAQDGFDLTVKPNYMNSLRLFAGADLRQDLNLGGFYLQPEVRAGYRYDFLGGQEKVKAAFVSQQSDPANFFTIAGPDPARGNLVLGGGLATTTGAWSIGVNYDYVRGFGGTNTLDQVGTITIVGRM
jgi:hypothetical protein